MAGNPPYGDFKECKKDRNVVRFGCHTCPYGDTCGDRASNNSSTATMDTYSELRSEPVGSRGADMHGSSRVEVLVTQSGITYACE